MLSSIMQFQLCCSTRGNGLRRTQYDQLVLTRVTQRGAQPWFRRPKRGCSLNNQSPVTVQVSKTPGRLFSNLNPNTLKHEPGSVFGAASLVAGTTVGAGILALPAVAQQSGFLASSTALVACYIFSVTTGLLLAEVNINTMCELGGRGTSINSMAKRTLGNFGTTLSVTTYVGLQYTLLVAYTSKGGELLSKVCNTSTTAGSAAFVALFSGLCYLSSPRGLDRVNSGLVAAVVITFLVLLAGAANEVDPHALLRSDWSAVPAAIPVIALAFVYQNVIPTIASSLEGDVVKVRQSVALGCLIPLMMFLAWDAVILGSTTTAVMTGQGGMEGVAGSAVQGAIIDPVAMLQYSNPVLGPWIDAFSFFAIATSFIGFNLGLTAFFSDALELPLSSPNPLPYLLAVIPPFLLATTYPDIFFTAIDFAGTYGVLVLFGIVPVLMAWSERYMGSTLTRVEVVPGGRATLVAVGALAAAAIGSSVAQDLMALAW